MNDIFIVGRNGRFANPGEFDIGEQRQGRQRLFHGRGDYLLHFLGVARGSRSGTNHKV